jgi:hypothetical protein
MLRVRSPRCGRFAVFAVFVENYQRTMFRPRRNLGILRAQRENNSGKSAESATVAIVFHNLILSYHATSIKKKMAKLATVLYVGLSI